MIPAPLAVSADTWWQIFGGFIGTVIVGAAIYVIQQRQARIEKVAARYLELRRTVPDHVGIKTLIQAGVLTLKSNGEVRAVLHRIEQHGQSHTWTEGPSINEDLLDFLREAADRDIDDGAKFIAFRIGRTQRGKKY
jgi:hypothetical protein